ncbi:MAG: Holliday junction resolvase RuvX [Armatimonadetes bacterium]|nr:Holliday junction resolvase RuvX [Armatimonadota bacterium]
MRVLAIDPGERRLGLAISDPGGTMALPLEVIERTDWSADVEHLKRVIEEHGVTTIVVGRPLTVRGEVGPQAKVAARLAARLRRALNLPVVEVDERFSTAEAERALRHTGARSAERRRRRDAVAAAVILQLYLDRERRDEPLRGCGGGAMLAP